MISVISRIDGQGQVTIPDEIRQQLGLKEGDSVEFLPQEGSTLLRPVAPRKRGFEEFIGIAPLPPSVGGSVAWVRSLRDDGDDPLAVHEGCD